MRNLLKGIVWIIILSLGLLLGIKLLPAFVWWQVLVFLVSCYVIGHISYQLFRLIDKSFPLK